MNLAAGAGLWAAFLFGLLQNAPLPLSSGDFPTAERIETGRVTVAPGDVLEYRIRLLPLASFPALPAPVAAQLYRHGCMIPQSFEAREPENVIHGAFRGSGSDDWAVLCSVSGTTTLYVFFAGQYDAPLALRSQPDTAWLGTEPGGSIFSSAWGIALRHSTELRAYPEFRRLHADHDGIEDARLERSSIIHYCDDGKWIVVDAGS
jgi:hypothetical protein